MVLKIIDDTVLESMQALLLSAVWKSQSYMAGGLHLCTQNLRVLVQRTCQIAIVGAILKKADNQLLMILSVSICRPGCYL